MPQPTDVSVIVVNWNTRTLLAQCLHSVAEHLAGDATTRCEVIVVDNASDDGSQEMVRGAFPGARLIKNTRNEGFARANNQGIMASSGRFVLLLNSDALLVQGAVQQMLRALDEDGTIGIAGVCLAFPDGAPQFCHGSFPTLWTEFRTLFGLHRWDLSKWNKLTEPHDVDWVSGACLMARKEMLDTAGMLDERFFFFGEEVDLCYRCKLAGWRVILVPSQPVVHVRAGSTGKSAQRVLRLFRGKLQYAGKHWGRARRAILRLMILTSSIMKLVIYRLLTLFSRRYDPSSLIWRQVVGRLLAGDY